MSEQRKPTCQACGGKGWLFCYTGNDQSPRHEVQRCDHCEIYDHDRAALEAVVDAAKSQLQLIAFVQTVALLNYEGEPGDDGTPFDPTFEDTITALNQVILEARQLLGRAGKCGRCGEVVAYVIGCPDGAEVCQDCFEAGQD